MRDSKNMGMCCCAGHSFGANTAGGSVPPVVSTKPAKLFLATVLDEDEGQEIDLPASFLLPPPGQLMTPVFSIKHGAKISL